MRKLLIISITILLVFLIYLSTIDRKVYFLVLSSNNETTYTDNIMKRLKKKGLLEKYITNFNEEDLRITDFIKKIEENETILINKKEQSIKNALIKADVLVLETGKIDLFTKMMYERNEEELYEYVDDLEKDLQIYFEIVREYCKEDIYVLSIYNPNNQFNQKIIDYMNNKIKNLSNQYKIHYISYTITEEMVEPNSLDLNQEGENEVYKNLYDKISKTLFNE